MESWPFLIAFGLLVLFFAWGVIGFLGKMQITRENRILAAAKVAELEKEKEKLASDIGKLNTPEGKEASIREKFGLAKEGEGEIIIVEEKPVPESEKKENGGFFSFLFFWRN